MEPEQLDPFRHLMTEDELRWHEERKRRRHRAKAWRVILCLLACFWIAALGLGWKAWGWAETRFPAAALAAIDGEE